MLILKGLKDLGLSSYSFDNLQYSAFQRPYFPGSIDFNISHSGNYVIFAISKTNRIGIDIEEIKEIPLLDFDSLFSKEELQRIYKVKNDYIPFYTLWTQKEAYLKAIGMGLNVPLNEVLVNNNKISHNHEEWFLHELKLDADYICHLLTDLQNPEILIEKVDF